MFSSKAAAGLAANESPVDASPDWVKDDFEVGTKESSEGSNATPPTVASEPSKVTSTPSEVVDSAIGSINELSIRPLSPSVLNQVAPPATTDKFVEEGMSCEAKSLYEGLKKCECCINWVGKTAEEVEGAKVLTAKVHGDAAVLTRQRNGHGGEDPFMLHSIVIQSPLLKRTLQKVLKDYPGVSPELDEVEFEAPFEPLFHRWDDLLEAGRNETSTETRKHIKVLQEVLEPEFEKASNTLRECRLHGVIKFDSLWVIFKPGDLIHGTVDGRECVMKLREAEYVQTTVGGLNFELQCDNVDFDGSSFGYGSGDIQIEKFRGTANTKDLPAMPLDLAPDKLDVKERLIARGRKFEKLRGYNFKQYKGSVALFDPAYMTDRGTTDIEERVIIDANAFYQFTGRQVQQLIPFEAYGVNGQARRITQDDGTYPPPPPPTHSTYGGSNTSSTPRIRTPRQAQNQRDLYGNPITPQKRQQDNKHVSLTEEQLLLCAPYVRGFLLRRKVWAKFCVDGISDIAWNEEAFESLVLPSNEKDLLLAFAEGQANGTAKFDDFIQGKGKGIVMLLSGAPGVGKTLTAESVAETMRVPLYVMSAGELGSYSENLERVLKDVLEKCAMWKAILLLDEADVFLEARTTNDLQRNAMVSVFLRLLEYYEGIMFLTTNRVETFDPAFESRIDVAFNYEVLSPASRRQIWSNFIMRLPEEERDISAADLDKLGAIELNGRQIKSAVKTAQMLAARKRERLGVRHTTAVLELRAHLLKEK